MPWLTWCGGPAALAAATDGDKVRANGVRAVGNLLAFAPAAMPPTDKDPRPHARTAVQQDRAQLGAEPGLPEDGVRVGQSAWLAGALRCLAGALAGGGPKVQWNACYALGALLRNAPAATAAAACGGMLCGLLRQVLAILRDSANFKAR